MTSSIRRRTTAGRRPGRCPDAGRVSRTSPSTIAQSVATLLSQLSTSRAESPRDYLFLFTPGVVRTQPVDNAEIVIRQLHAEDHSQGRIFLRQLASRGQYAQEDHDGGAIFCANGSRNAVARSRVIQHSESVTTTAPVRQRHAPGRRRDHLCRERLPVRIVGCRASPVKHDLHLSSAALGIALLAPAVGSVLSMNATAGRSARFAALLTGSAWCSSARSPGCRGCRQSCRRCG